MLRIQSCSLRQINNSCKKSGKQHNIMNINGNSETYSESESSSEGIFGSANLGSNVRLEKKIKLENGATVSVEDLHINNECNSHIVKSRDCYDTCSLIKNTWNLTKDPTLKSSLDENHPLNNSLTSLNQSDVSDDGRLVIVEFNKTDKNSSHNPEDHDDNEDGESSHSSENITTNIRNLSKDMALQPSASDNHDSNSCSDNVESSTSDFNFHSRLSIDSDDPLPIQAEVVMSEGSDDENELELPTKILPPKLTDKRSSKGKDTYCEYIVQNHEWTRKKDLTGWQLEALVLPHYSPTIDPPAWLKYTIPSKGYVCEACGDKFNIENSLIEHKERRSVLVKFDCKICKEKLIFHNKCSFKEHCKRHALTGSNVNQKDVIVHPLPLCEMKLLQPIKVNKIKKSTPFLRPPALDQMKLLQPIMMSEVEPSSPKENSTCKATIHDLTSVASKLSLSSEKVAKPPTLKKCSVECHMCEDKFGSAQELINHLKTDNPWSDEKVECKKCRLVLPSLCSGKAHILIHSSSLDEPAVCPECGDRYTDQRKFVTHLNDCGHQFRKSGVVCSECDTCFFHFVDDFLAHWISEHCSKYRQCFMCGQKVDNKCFHECKYSNPRQPPNFNYIVACPVCPYKISRRSSTDELEVRAEVKKHLWTKHSTLVNRVHYVFKSKFCSNAFRTKKQLNLHHEKWHRKNNNLHNKNCSLYDDVQTQIQKYFGGVEEGNSFVMLKLSTLLSSQTSVIPSSKPMPVPKMIIMKYQKEDKNEDDNMSKAKDFPKTIGSPAKMSKKLTKEDPLPYEKLKPVNCYQCGYVYSSIKQFRRHYKMCKQSVVSLRCDSCRTTISKDDFPRHCVAHINEGKFACIFCSGRPFESRFHLQAHIEMHATSQFKFPVTCIFCGLVMTDTPSAIAHLIAKHEMDRVMMCHQCTHCGRKFGGKKGLLIHITKCSFAPRSAIFKNCNFCKRSINLDVFRKHMITHLADGKLLCCVCDGRAFDTSLALLHHLEDHSRTLDFPSECTICSFNLTDYVSCLQHLKDEHGFSNVKCKQCEMSYNYWFKLRRHIDIAHKACSFVNRRYVCWICKACDYVKKGSILKHIRECHKLNQNQIDEQLHIKTRSFGTMPSEIPLHGRTCGKKTTPPRNDVPLRSPQRPDPHNHQSHPNHSNLVNIKQELSDKLTHTDNELHLNHLFSLSEESHTIGVNDDVVGGNVPAWIPLDFQSDSSRCAKTSTPKTPTVHSSPVRTIKRETTSDSEQDSPYKGIKIKFVFRNQDEKLVNKTKVVIERMSPESTDVKPPLITKLTTDVSEVDKSPERQLSSVEPVARRKITKLKKPFLTPRQNDVKRRNLAKTVKPLILKKSTVADKLLTPKKLEGTVTSPLTQKKPAAVANTRTSRGSRGVVNSLKNTQSPDVACRPKPANRTSRKNLQCEECTFTTNKKIKLEKHIASHQQDTKTANGFHCEECGELFVVKPSLDRHLFFVHKIKKNRESSVAKPVMISSKRSRSVDGPEVSDQKSKRRMSEMGKSVKVSEEVVKKPKRRISEVRKTAEKPDDISKKATRRTIELGKVLDCSKDTITKSKRLSEIGKSKEFHCNVCKENFSSSPELYAHLKSHGMAFLKMGQKRRSLLSDPI